jgi:hypothetical protein
MAQRYGGKIVTDGLVLCLDAHDAKSYAGEPTQNYVINTSSTGGWWGDGSSQTGLGSKGAVAITDENLKYNGYDTVLWTPGTSRNCYLNSTEDFNYSETSTEWTFSAYLKYEDGSTISSMSVYMYYPSSDGSGTGTVTDVGGGWYRVRRTRTGSSNYISLAGFTGIAAMKKIYISGWQLEKKQYTTPVTSPATSRSATDGWVDRSGNSNSGTLVNGTNTGVSHYRDGQVIMPVSNSYLEFDGTDDYIDLSTTAGNFGTDPFTVSVWLNFDALGSFYNKYAANQDQILFSYSSGKPYFIYNAPNGTDYGYTVSNTSLATGTWYNLVATVDRSSNFPVIYVNGVNDGSSLQGSAGSPTTANMDNTGNLIIGRGLYSGNYSYFNGKMAQLLVYKGKALTAAEVLSNYNTVKPRFGL